MKATRRSNTCSIKITHDDWLCDWGYEIIKILKSNKSRYNPSTKEWIATYDCLKEIEDEEKTYFLTRVELLQDIKDDDIYLDEDINLLI